MDAKAQKTGWVAAAVLAAALTGCSQTSMRITGGEAKLPAEEGSPAFLDRVASEPTVNLNDAYRGLLILLEGQDPAESFQQRVEKLAEKGIVARCWRHEAGRTLTKGQLAYMVSQACGIRGGVILHLTGPSQRYCLRELQYLNMMSQGTVMAPVTGLEYVAVLSRADAYRRTGQLTAIMETEP